MTNERTLSIIKPDAVKKHVLGKIIDRFESNGLRIVASKMTRLSRNEAERFYSELVDFISSGPVLIMVLEGENAVLRNREIMGATNPKDAAPGTIRRDFADSIQNNAVHGSDSLENAKHEVAFFFKDNEIHS